MNRSHTRVEAGAPERPITFRAAEDLGAFELALLWADRAARPLNERPAYNELTELVCMSALFALIRVAGHPAGRDSAKIACEERVLSDFVGVRLLRSGEH